MKRLLSPVFGKELMEIARRYRLVLLRGVLPLGLLVTLHLSMSAVEAIFSAYRLERLNAIAAIGARAFYGFMALQTTLALILIPLLTAPVVAGERERDTLGLLMLADICPRHILLDKLLARLLWLGLIFLCALPVLVVVLGFGGVTSDALLTAYIGLLSVVLFSTAIGVFCTAISGSRTEAALLAWLGIGALALLAPVGGDGRLGITALWEGVGELLSGSPFLYYGLLSSGPGEATHPWYDLLGHRNLGLDTALGFLQVSAAALVLSLGVSSWLLPRFIARPSRHWLSRLNQRIDRLFAPRGILGKRLLGERRLGRYPLLWRELHRRLWTSRTLFIRALYVQGIAAALILAAIVYFEWSEEIALILLLAYGLFIVTVLVLVSASAFAGEKESGTWEVLLTTPIGATEYILAKWLGALKAVLPMAIVFAASTYFLAQFPFDLWYYDNVSFLEALLDQPLAGLTHLALLLLLVSLIGLGWSLLVRRRMTAILLTFATLPVIVMVYRYLASLADDLPMAFALYESEGLTVNALPGLVIAALLVVLIRGFDRLARRR